MKIPAQSFVLLYGVSSSEAKIDIFYILTAFPRGNLYNAKKFFRPVTRYACRLVAQQYRWESSELYFNGKRRSKKRRGFSWLPKSECCVAAVALWRLKDISWVECSHMLSIQRPGGMSNSCWKSLPRWQELPETACATLPKECFS